MLEEARLAGAGLDHAAVGREIALEHGERAFGIDRIRDGADDVVIVDFGARDVLAERLAGHRHGIEMQMIPDPAHQAGQAAGIEEILHQIFVAARPHIGDHGHLAAGDLEIVETDVLAGAARLRDQMDDRIGRAAHRHRHRDGVLERLAGLDLLRRQIFPHHLDDAAAAFRTHADVAGVRGRNRRRARQASCRSIRRSRSWSRRCPWSCRCRSCARCRPRHRPSPCRRFSRRAARPSISRRRSPSPASCPSSCRAASARRADRSRANSCWWRRAADAGVVLSQPPISTTPSTGWPRSSSSASIASILR